MGYTYDSLRGREEGGGEKTARPGEVAYNGGIVLEGWHLPNIVTYAACWRSRPMCVPPGFLPASDARIASLATESGKASHRAFLDHFAREVHGLRVGMPRVKVDGDSPRLEKRASVLASVLR